jgi:hypothetical protein
MEALIMSFDPGGMEDEMNKMIEEQNAQKEQMRRNLAESRMDIIRGQGSQNWIADRSGAPQYKND